MAAPRMPVRVAVTSRPYRIEPPVVKVMQNRPRVPIGSHCAMRAESGSLLWMCGRAGVLQRAVTPSPTRRVGSNPSTSTRFLLQRPLLLIARFGGRFYWCCHAPQIENHPGCRGARADV